MRLLFELSGEHPTLPFAEIECVGRIVAFAPQVAVADVEDAGRTGRLSLVHHVMVHLGDAPATKAGIMGLLRELGEEAKGTFSVRVRRIQGSPCELSNTALERLIGSMIHGRVDLEAPEAEYRGLVSGDRFYLGKVIAAIDRSSFEYRNPLRRPFFHPGVMRPKYARAMVNLSLVQENEILLDPCCGTGGILLEANLVGARVLGGDADRSMILGTLANLPGADVIRHDASALPIRDSTIDAVVTDLPYGQSVSIHGNSVASLYAGIVREIVRVLKKGRRAVVVTHVDARPLVVGLATVLQFHEQRIHKSLTRRIMVLEKE
ncbi:MAG: methyltransferase domain-containing protein [Methanomicrobiales archaeon]|nr:methyltransferase domain-containing protein [Methanomicrobiales archaeon]